MTGFLKLLFRNRLAGGGAVILVVIVMIAVLAPLLPLQPPDITNTAQRFLPPLSEGHPLGTDHLGRDQLSRLLWGTRLSLAVGCAAAVVAAVIGSAIGITSGYFGGRIDNLMMRGVDMLMAFPYILLALAIVAALGPGLTNALIAVAVVNIPFFARNIRGITVGLVGREFIDAARLGGKGHLSIILTELLPNVMPVIIIAMSTTIGWMILETAGLSFLGLGSQPPKADLGSMLGEARSALITNPWGSVIPGLMIFLIVMSVNLLGDGVRDALDPRLKSGALSRSQARTAQRRSDFTDQPQKGLLDLQELETQFHISKRVFKAVNQVSLHIEPGECLGIIGESGSGKSVMALSIMGLVASPPGIITGGAVKFEGRNLLDLPFGDLRDMRGRRIAYIFQDPLATLHPLYTVGDQMVEAITEHFYTSRAEARTRALELLKTVRVPNAERRLDNYPHELSGGMRQRIGIAMALCNEPDLIIADEPTTALDVTVQAQILALLADLRRDRGLSIMFITHDFGVVGQLCDRVAVMYAGKIVEEGPTNELFDRPAHPYTKRLIASVPELGGGKRELVTIPGLPPAVDDLPHGCAFAPRCHRAQDACRVGAVPDHRNKAHTVRCHFPETAEMEISHA